MKIKFATLGTALLFTTLATAQCVSISCPPSVSTTNDTGSCGSVVTFAAPVSSSTCLVSIRDTFNFTGAPQTFVVPSGVTVLTMEVWGAQGGANWVNNTNFGGYTKADVPVTPGSTLYIYVGGQPTTTAGGYNGGGAGDGAGKGGGGGTDVRTSGNTYADRLIVAGGGGGAGYWSNLHVVGGVGGGLTGGDGYRNTTADMGGLGATQSGPGANGTCINFNVTSMAGGFGYGGTPLSYNCGCEGYGGGGGWYGGAGSGNCRGGGGGCGYVVPSATNVSYGSGVRVGNGRVILSFQGSVPPPVVQTAGLPSGSLFPIGTTTNVFLADDGSGNTDTCMFTVTVTDDDAPTFSAVQNITVAADSGMCSAVVTWSPIYASDNCTVTSYTSSASSGSTFNTGTTTVTLIATDVSGNTDSTSFTVTVNDTQAPIISGCPSNIVMCEGNIVSFGTPSATDNCASTLQQISGPANGDTLSAGSYTVVFVATDNAGNADTCSFDVVVNPLPAVTLDLSMNNLCQNDAPFTLNGESPSGGVWSGTAVTGNQFDPASSGSGTFAVSYTVTDLNGCVATAVDSITVSICTGVDNNGAVQFSMFPNPANENFVLNTIENGTLSIIDAAGKNVYHVNITQKRTEINVANLSSGVYTVTFMSESGRTSNGNLLINR